MAGGGGSTGGIGAQSPAVNPPTTGFGQAGNAFAGQLGNIGATALGGTQQPMVQTGQFGSQPIPMGNNPAYNGQPQSPMGGMPPDYATSFPTPRGFGQAPQQGPFMGGVSAPNSPGQMPFNPSMMGGEGFTPGFDQRQLTPDMMANMQQAAQAAAQQGQGPMGLGQAAQTALTQQQMSKLGGLAALLGGNPAPPTPAVSAPPTARPAPVASKSTTKTSVVPPKTPPAVASAIQKLAAKKQAGMR
jgi:hypothetical protein